MATYEAGRPVPGIVGYNLEYVTQTHPLYQLYVPRWTYLGDAYSGGYDFYLGKYLEPYYYESTDDYMKRLRQVSLDNHVKSVVGIYASFLYRKEPKRDYASLENDPNLQNFLMDADLDGRSFTQFMRDVATMSMVYGNVWIAVDKPMSNAFTRADELEQGIRPYVQMFTPDNVLDWNYERTESGLYRLTYVKVKEETQKDYTIIREYTLDTIRAFRVELNSTDDPIMIMEQPNELNMIPVCPVYAQRGNKRGIGISLVNDIADVQRSIYEEYSEVEQIIRLTNHPALVKTRGSDASAGAGAVIQMEDGLDPGLKPYLLQPNGASIESVLSSITKKVESIDRMASLGGIRSVESRRLSGIGLQTEFQMLNSRLSDIALNLEHSEEMIWRMYAMYQDMRFDGYIEYPRSFSIQDKANEVTMLKQAKEAKILDPKINDALDKMILETIVEDEDEVKEILQVDQQPQVNMDASQHPPVEDVNALVSHLREMVEQGYSNDQIKQLHPELARLFGNGTQ